MENRESDSRFESEYPSQELDRMRSERAEWDSFNGENSPDRQSRRPSTTDWFERNSRRHQAHLQHRTDRMQSDRAAEQYREDFGHPSYGERFGFSGYGRAHYNPDINRDFMESPEVESWREGARFSDREQDYRGGRWNRETHGYHNGDGRYHDGDGRSEYNSRSRGPRFRENWRGPSYSSRNPESREYADYTGGSTEQDIPNDNGTFDTGYSRGGNNGFEGGSSHTMNYAGIAPKNYQRSDARMEEDICERVTANPYIDASDIEIKVVQSEAILTGTVRDRRMKRLAEDIADETPGIRNVNNQIHVERPQSKSMPPSGNPARLAPTTQRRPA
jgi:osmotically-inducible protein OsmY